MMETSACGSCEMPRASSDGSAAVAWRFGDIESPAVAVRDDSRLPENEAVLRSSGCGIVACELEFRLVVCWFWNNHFRAHRARVARDTQSDPQKPRMQRTLAFALENKRTAFSREAGASPTWGGVEARYYRSSSKPCRRWQFSRQPRSRRLGAMAS